MPKACRFSLGGMVRLGAALVLAAAVVPSRVAAQAARQDSLVPGSTVRIAAGPEYEAGFFHRFFFGTRYRKLWATPIDVQVLGNSAVAQGGVIETRGKETNVQKIYADLLEKREGKWVVVRSMGARVK